MTTRGGRVFPVASRVLPTLGRSVPVIVTLTGTIVEALSPRCTLLQTADRTYQLTGPAAKGLVTGAAVSVTGREARDRRSVCQQGVPFVVESVESVETG